MSQFVAETGTHQYTTASLLAKSGAGRLLGIWVSVANTTPTIKLWDNTAASGTVLVSTFIPVGVTFYRIPAAFTKGLYITISGTVECTLFTI